MLKHLVAAGLIMMHAQLPAASAAGPGGSATIEWDRETRPEVVLEDVVWTCTGTDCRGSLYGSGPRALARYCKTLARYGKVTSFKTDAGAFAEAELLRCNKHRGS